jgi:hypothetical protein
MEKNQFHSSLGIFNMQTFTFEELPEELGTIYGIHIDVAPDRAPKLEVT